MGWLLNVNNPVMRFIVKLFDCMCLSLLWVLTCLPVFTFGAATSALFCVIRRYIRREEGNLWSCYWSAFRENFKRSTLCALVVLALLALFVVDALVFRTMYLQAQPLGFLYWLALLLLALALTWCAYLFAYGERFDGSVKDVLRLSGMLMLLHPVKTLTVMALVLGGAALIVMAPGMLGIVPGVGGWMCEVVIDSVFRAHLRPEDRERLEQETAQDT